MRSKPVLILTQGVVVYRKLKDTASQWSTSLLLGNMSGCSAGILQLITVNVYFVKAVITMRFAVLLLTDVTTCLYSEILTQ